MASVGRGELKASDVARDEKRVHRLHFGGLWPNGLLLVGVVLSVALLGPGKAIPGAAYAAETLKGTVDTFKHAFGMKSGSPNPEKGARKCTSCGASISGVIGRVVRCPYCDSDQQL